MVSRRLRGDGDEELVPAHPALADALDVRQVGILILHVMHDLGPLGVRVVPLPIEGEVHLPVISSRILLHAIISGFVTPNAVKPITLFEDWGGSDRLAIPVMAPAAL